MSGKSTDDTNAKFDEAFQRIIEHFLEIVRVAQPNYKVDDND